MNPVFQSRNRVWAGSRRGSVTFVRACTNSFNLAIEFGPVHASRLLAHRVHRHLGFNLAIEFGPVHASSIVSNHNSNVVVSISQSSLGRFTLNSKSEEKIQ